MSIVINGDSGGRADGNWGAFTVTNGVAELNPDSVSAGNIPNGELPPQKIAGYSGVSGNNGDNLSRVAGSWTATDPEPYYAGFIPGTVATGTYVCVLKLRRAVTINNLVHKLASGTANVSVQIDGVNVTGLSSVSVTSTEATTAATAANSAAEGTTISFIVNSGTSPVGLSFQIEMTYV